MLEIIGWLVWGFAALMGVGFLMMKKPEKWVQSASRRQGMILLAGVIVTLIFPVSKFHLVWVAVLSFYLPMYMMKLKGRELVKNADKHLESMVERQHKNKENKTGDD